MSNWRNSQTMKLKTWDDVCGLEEAGTFCPHINPQNSYSDIMVFPCRYSHPTPESEVKRAKSKGARSKANLAESSDPKPIPGLMSSLPLPIWAPRDYKRLRLDFDYLPMNASELQLDNLFQQIHSHYGEIGAHVLSTSGLQGILPTTRWPLPPNSKVNDTYYIVRMKDTRKGKKAFFEFLFDHKNNYNVAWRLRRRRSEFKTAKWCCFIDHKYLNEQEPFKGNMLISKYDSGYSAAKNLVRVWTDYFEELFDFLYLLYANPGSQTTTTGYRLFQTFFLFMCEGKRFPAIEKFNLTNWKKAYQLEDALDLTIPIDNAVNAWSSCSDLVLLLAIVLIEDNLAKTLMAMKPNPKYPKLPHYSLVKLFEQFLKHRTKAQSLCEQYTKDTKGLHMILLLEKDETGSFGIAAFERLSNHCLNLLMFNRDHVLALKARQEGFQGIMLVNIGEELEEEVVDIAEEKCAEEKDSESSSIGEELEEEVVDIAEEKCAEEKDSESSSRAAGTLFPQDAILEVDVVKEKPAEKQNGTNLSSGTAGFQGLLQKDKESSSGVPGRHSSPKHSRG